MYVATCRTLFFIYTRRCSLTERMGSGTSIPPPFEFATRTLCTRRFVCFSRVACIVRVCLYVVCVYICVYVWSCRVVFKLLLRRRIAYEYLDRASQVILRWPGAAPVPSFAKLQDEFRNSSVTGIFPPEFPSVDNLLTSYNNNSVVTRRHAGIIYLITAAQRHSTIVILLSLKSQNKYTESPLSGQNIQQQFKLRLKFKIRLKPHQGWFFNSDLETWIR